MAKKPTKKEETDFLVQELEKTLSPQKRKRAIEMAKQIRSLEIVTIDGKEYPQRRTPNLKALKELNSFVKKSLGRKLSKNLVKDIANSPSIKKNGKK